MIKSCRHSHTLVALLVLGCATRFVLAQQGSEPLNDAPNPYRTVENWAQLPEGRTWGSLSAVDIDKNGKTIWVAERCGGNSACLESPNVDPILHFDASGKLIKSFGAGMLVSPHGIHVDRDGNIWVTDARAPTPDELQKFPGEQRSVAHTDLPSRSIATPFEPPQGRFSCVSCPQSRMTR